MLILLESALSSRMALTNRPFEMSRRLRFVCAVLAVALGLSGCAGHVSKQPPVTTGPFLVGYLPDYDGNYADFARTLNLARLTHLMLAFGHAPMCSGTCTAQSDMTISLQQSDADIAALVNSAHSAGLKVMISLGGGDSAGDASISQFYRAGLSTSFAAAIDTWVTAHNLDGVDVDIEDPSTMGAPYGAFVSALARRMHAEGKILSAAVAPYLEPGIPDSALAQFDLLNVMTYSTYAQAQSDLGYYADRKGVAPNRLILGVPFFATADGNTSVTYAQLLAAYPNAWQTDEVSGGSLDGGVAFDYVGESTMARETKLGATYGGIMIWELSQDAAPPHSLLDVIRKNI